MSGLSVNHFALRPESQQGSNDLEMRLSQKSESVRDGGGDGVDNEGSVVKLCKQIIFFANKSIFLHKN